MISDVLRLIIWILVFPIVLFLIIPVFWVMDWAMEEDVLPWTIKRYRERGNTLMNRLKEEEG